MIRPPATVLRGDALSLPVADSSVDLVVTSPPYFGLRSYQDGGEHYAGQIGDEATPGEFVDALLAATREMIRVLKPTGSIWVNLGDKYVSSGGHRSLGQNTQRAGRRSLQEINRPETNRTRLPEKSLIGIPWRYALRCIDELGLILRAEIVWSKPNGLPESVTDRVRRSHETWFHFTTRGRYFSAIDELREEPVYALAGRRNGAGARPADVAGRPGADGSQHIDGNPLGKLPGSVWEIATQPLTLPAFLGVDHHAAFPMEWPRRIIPGWSPREVCSSCGEGRRPYASAVALDLSRPQARRAQALADDAGLTEDHLAALLSVGVSDTGRGAATQSGTGKNTADVYRLAGEARAALGGYAREYLLRRPTAFGYRCACPDTSAPSTPGIVLDPFGGTGTTALVARALGRRGITVDRSADYCRAAQWRTTDPGQLATALKVTKPEPVPDAQLDLFGEPAA